MPTYHYQCSACNHEFDEFQKMSDPPLDKCPLCGGPAKRIISGGAGFLLKGSGFYTTDYRKESYKKAAASDKAASEPAKVQEKKDK